MNIDYIYDITFFVPCLNEEGNIVNTLDIIISAVSETNLAYEIIVIDDNSYNFNVPSASILPPSHVSTNALFIGNYYEAPVSSDEGDFFNRNAGINEGVYPYEYGRVSGDPDVFLFNHPLNAEVHDLKIFDDHITDKKIKYNEKFGQRNFGSEMNQDRLMFYVPPLFTKSSKTRESLITPFQTERKWTQNPFNTTFSFGVGGYLINLQNLKDF